jgi:hypothetical protein
MRGAMLRHLILKDLRLQRPLIVASLIAGAFSLALCPLSPTAFYVGSVSLLCVLIVANIMTVMTGVVQERKDKVLLFVLSLPISTVDYTIAKACANVATYLAIWLPLSGGALVLILTTPAPDGIVPFVTAILGFVLTYYCVLLAVALALGSDFWNMATIIGGNISANFFIALVLRLPTVVANRRGETPVWGTEVVAFLVLELVVAVLALGLAFALVSRKKDFV